MVWGKVGFSVEGMVEEICGGKDYVERVEREVIVGFGLIVGIELFKGVMEYFGKFMEVMWDFGKLNEGLMGGFGMLVDEEGSGGIV